MIQPRIVLMTLLVSGAALTSGCRHLAGGDCNKPQPYDTAAELPALRIPPGLDAPDTRGALKVPELSEPEAPRDPKARCLQEPPAITTTAAPARKG